MAEKENEVDAFTADKLDWLEQVMLDTDLGHLAVRVAALLSVKHLNRELGLAWPSQETMAAALGVTSRSIRTAIRDLVERGHLMAEVRTGTGHSSRYRPIFYPETRKSASGSSSIRSGRTLPVPSAENRKKTAVTSGSQLPPNPMKEPNEKNPVCGGVYTAPLESPEDLVRRLAKEAGVTLDPRDVIQRCKSHHGTKWEVRLARWTAGAITRLPAPQRAIAPVYEGPAEIRVSVVHHRGEDYAKGYLDRFRWDADARVLIAHNDFAMRRFKEDMGSGWARRHNLSFGVAPANDTQPFPTGLNGLDVVQ